MVYPKPMMRLQQLKDMGIPESILLRIYRTRGQKVARKANPAKKNSPIIYDTAELEKVLQREQEAENRAIPRGGIPCLREVMRK